ncbi:MAG: CPBP family intramembrane glutamic endopeptidase [Pseudomonadota bacterium]
MGGRFLTEERIIAFSKGGADSAVRGNLVAKIAGLAIAIAISVAFYQTLRITSAIVPDLSFIRDAYPHPRGALAASVSRTLLGMFVYVLLLTALVKLTPLNRAFAEMWRAAPARGWPPAAITTAIQITVILFLVLGGAAPVFEASLFNLHVSMVTALGGGVFEEIVHRGAIILTLAYAGFSRLSAIIISAFLFASNHVGWVDFSTLDFTTAMQMLSPLWGTFFLGLAFGFTFTESRCRIWPVIAAHSLINLVIEPWLALAFVGPRL